MIEFSRSEAPRAAELFGKKSRQGIRPIRCRARMRIVAFRVLASTAALLALPALLLSARELAAAQVVASAPAHAAPPSAQCVRHRWTDDALHVLDAQGEHTLFTLSLRAWGRGEDLVLAGTPRVSWNGSRRALDRDGIVEWYEIGGDAIEHGFTLLRPPESACETGAAVRLQLAVDAQLDVEVAAQGCDAVFRASDGITIYYEGLVAWDVTGSAVDARLERTEAGLAILVDDRVAVYPITVDPWIVVQEAKFTGGGPTSIAFGFDVDVSAEAVLVGAPSADPGGLINAGEARIFERAAGAWSLTAALRPSDAAAGDAFGFGLSIGADTAVVGAQGDDNQQGANAGAVYVFERIGGVWQEQEKLVASDLVADDFFGQHVALDGDTLAVSAPGQAPGSLGASGAVYVYVRSAGTWTLQTKFGSPPWATDLGDSLALHGDVLVAGAPDSSPEFVTGAGTAYVYRRTGTEWGAPFELRADVLGVGHAFGRSVAVHGDVVAVSARSESAVYVFRPVGGAWIKEAKLGSVAPTGASGLGSSVDVEGDRIVAANTSPHAPGANFAGEAYLFRRGPLGWTQQARFRASDPVPSLMLGNSIALSGDTVVAGTNRDSAYVFRVEQTSGFCFGDGSLATACPCAPPDFVPVPSGGARSGCASALSAAGARLEVGGLVSPDTLGFVAEIGAGYGGFALLVKSDARDLAGIASGDGVRCVDGNMIRFGGHFAGAHEALGTWTYPNSVQSTAVGVATLQAPGQTAYYQLLYRHAAPGFCSPGTTNWSNAVHIDW